MHAGASALHYMKTDIESRKASNTWGVLLWQFSEIWPTGGWGSVEYPYNSGGGRWKPLHHFLSQHVFTPIAVAVCADGRAYVRNDLPQPFTGTLNVSAVQLDSGVKSPLPLAYRPNVLLCWC